MSILGHKTTCHRLAALVDGVFAIVMTIMVLDIKVPHETDVLRNITLAHFLTGQFQDILIYMTSFIMMGYIWLIHHGELHVMRFTDRTHMWLTMSLLMFVALIPFSTALVNKFPGDLTAELYMAGHMFIIGIINLASWIYVTKDKALIAPEITGKQIAGEKKKLMVLPLVAVLSALSGIVSPMSTSYVLLLAPVIITVMELRWGANKLLDAI
jgi:uncharacterized membrane protein